MAWCEMHPNIRKWSSEESVCPYYDPVRQKHRRYFIDFKLEFDSGRILYVEVKPRQETKPPKITARKSDGKIMLEMATWGTNQAKWKAASEWAAKRGGKFVVWSEKELALLGIISLEKEKPRRKRS